VNINQRARLVIEGAAGGTPTLTAAAGGQFVLNIDGSQNIFLRRLVLNGGRGARISRSGVVMEGVRMENSAQTGLSIDQGSVVRLNGSTPNGPVEIRGSAATGLGASDSTLFLLGSHLVEGNAVGVVLNRCKATLQGLDMGIVVRDNGGGFSLSGTDAAFVGSILVQNNGNTGVSVGFGSITFSGFLAGDSSVHGTVIEGHAVLGMNVAASSGVSFSGPQKVRNNGGSGTGEQRGGIVVGTTSRLQTASGTEITGNTGPGVIVRFNGAVAMTGTVVSGNTEGVVTRRSSVTFLDTGNTISGNAAVDVSCDDTSVVFGALEGVGTVKCNRVEKPAKTK
jgi:hypothetical protein